MATASISLTAVCKLRWVKKAPADPMTIKNVEALRLMAMAIILEQEGKLPEAQAFEQKALDELEKELRDYLSGVKQTVNLETDNRVAVHRSGGML